MRPAPPRLHVAAADTARWHRLRAAAPAPAWPAGSSWYRITDAAGRPFAMPTDPDPGGQGDDPENRAVIDLYNEIGWGGITASAFVADLRGLGVATIDLHINSPGGDVYDGLAIYRALLDHPATVTVHVDGLAASAASFIAQAGDQVVMASNAEMMIHDALGMTIGNEADHLEMAELLARASDNIASIYAARAGGGVAGWRARMRDETWYTGAEAVEAGLADEVAKVGRRRPAARAARPAGGTAANADTVTVTEPPPPPPPPPPATPDPGPDAGDAPDGDTGEGPSWDDLAAELDTVPWDPRALHLALLDAADAAGVETDTLPLRERLAGLDFDYDPDVFRAAVLDALEAPAPAPTDPDPRRRAEVPTHISIDEITDAIREAMA